MRSFFSRPIPSTVDTKPVERRTLHLLQELDSWAIRCPHLTVLPTAPGHHIVSRDMETLVASGASAVAPNASTIILTDSFVALNAANYEVIRLILTLLLMKVSPTAAVSPTMSYPPSPESIAPSLFDVATASSQAILKITSYMESKHPIGFDFIRSVFPLVVVGILGPRQEEKTSAQDMLDRWAKTRGMAGLCAAWLQA
jgi:hypothetical protein